MDNMSQLFNHIGVVTVALIFDTILYFLSALRMFVSPIALKDGRSPPPSLVYYLSNFDAVFIAQQYPAM